MATLIPAIGEPRYIAPANGTVFRADELHGLVGGFFEALVSRMFIEAAIGPGGPLIMFINEDGKRHALPPNRFATALAYAGGVLPPGDLIVGDVVLCTYTEAGEGDGEDEREVRP